MVKFLGRSVRQYTYSNCRATGDRACRGPTASGFPLCGQPARQVATRDAFGHP